MSFVSRARYEPVGDTVRVFPGPPDLAVEVVSPTDRPPDLHAKVADYLAAGTPLVWVVNPQDASVGADVLSGFAVPLCELFEI